MSDAILDAAWVAQEAQALSNWGRWGTDDQIGSWNLVTPEKVLAAVASVETGAVFSLALPFGASGPSADGIPGRPNAIHLMGITGTDAAAGAQDRVFPGSAKFADDWVIMNLSTSTQWDGFCHVFHEGFSYNGVAASQVSSWGARRNAIPTLRGQMVTRGVLIDLPRFRGVEWLEPGTAIQPEELDAAVDSQGVVIESGDAVVIRTGQLSQVRAVGSWDGYAGTADAPGLGARCGRWLAERDVAAVASDTWGLEVSPYETPDTMAPLHQIILSHCGISIGEMFDLDELATECAADRRYTFLLVAPVLPLDGAVNTPVNPMAIR